MSIAFRSSGRTVCTDQAVPQDLTNETLKNHQFVRLVASGKRFVKCDFRNSTFEACYLRKCTFDSCNFSGCHFDRCQLPGTSFQGCRFDYATFERTAIEPEILKTGCPGFENLQMRFARSLRTNFQEIGDSDAANEAILIELAATKIHLRKALFSRESYYRDKYRGFARAKMTYTLARFQILDFVWGNGEKPKRLIYTVLLFIFGMAIFDVVKFGNYLYISDYLSSIWLAPQVLLGAAIPPRFGTIYLSVIIMVRLIFFALLFSIILKRFHRR